MRKLMIFALFAVGLAAFGGYAQEMPEEIKAFLDNYTKDSTAKWGPLKYKRWGTIPSSVQIKDLRFRTLQIYNFKRDVPLNKYSDTVTLSEVIAPNGFWRVLVMAHNKPLYELTIDNRNRKPIVTEAAVPAPIGSDFGSSTLWDPLLKKYLESTGINPILVGTSSLTNGSFGQYQFLYFKQLGPRKIYYANRRGYNPTLDSLFTASIETLDDSKKLVNWKKRDIAESEIIAGERMRLEKAKVVGSGEDTEQKKSSLSPLYMQGDLKDENVKDLFPIGGGQ
jgi:hypothetical protein